MIWETTNSKNSRYFLYLLFGVIAFYFNRFVDRTDFILLISCYSSLFLLYGLLIKNIFSSKIASSEIIIAAVGIRLLLIGNIPNLSDDYYRFIWDGVVNTLHVNPFAFTPEFLLNQFNNSSRSEFLQTDIYANLNSTEYYSIYPPVCQWIFTGVSYVAGNSIFLHVLLLKTCMALFEAGSIVLLIRILRKLQLPISKAAYYAFNPLVIIELTGNIHMEAMMIFFLLLSIYLLLNNFFLPASIFLGISISVKLWPLMLLPLLFRRLEIRHALKIIVIALLIVGISFLPYYKSGSILNYFTSFRLYFQTFEFNASIYYALKWMFQNNYNYVILIQRILPVILTITILLIAFSKRIKLDFITLSILVFTLYFLCSTTIHPWYLTPLIALTSITILRYSILWSFLICFTYITYNYLPYQENLIIVAIEYLILYAVIMYEFFNLRKSIK
ncbi:MAG: DUF2029 domain-containing protein [Chitinophagales bacterium]|nr:DUF2029 domain-containing protein [Chitinophagales bacterium]